MKFPVLMYHALWATIDDPARLNAFWNADPQLCDPGARLYALDERVFAQQMNAIRASGLATARNWSELDPPLTAKTSPGILITFDDGHRSNHEIALPALLHNKLCAVFFITTDWIGAHGFMNETQLRELRAAGMLLGTHGCSHRYFSDLNETDLRDEMAKSKDRLEKILGEEIPALALPGGRNQPKVRQIAQAVGYRHLFTSRIARADANGNPLDWPRIPITNRQSPRFLAELLKGNDLPVRKMARSAAMRGWAKRLLGNRLYDRLRNGVIK